ncbi:hypothetical protein PISMIDRAFT_507567 [Pisolithus microcarpus 441]|uniref:Unplaced genomic scaffold scaffold_56, whole genome shotgun sequence n=1 Tax=Pisolithus microcarpus 441 TaxID=765257 RepID=A0A0C9YCA5_9AGAM|nr:hypothetical protein BKA83DRAFT_507567 [Pisolithus microcarpus]KIK22395.1 hypothetical protein PISMIDRAFT_507567 [Pisolithus microcarpus 441]
MRLLLERRHYEDVDEGLFPWVLPYPRFASNRKRLLCFAVFFFLFFIIITLLLIGRLGGKWIFVPGCVDWRTSNFAYVYDLIISSAR